MSRWQQASRNTVGRAAYSLLLLLRLPDLPSALEISAASSQHPRSTIRSAWREVATSPVAPASRPSSPHKQRSLDAWERHHHRGPSVRHSRSGSVSMARRLSRGKECGLLECTRRTVQCMDRDVFVNGRVTWGTRGNTPSLGGDIGTVLALSEKTESCSVESLAPSLQCSRAILPDEIPHTRGQRRQGRDTSARIIWLSLAHVCACVC